MDEDYFRKVLADLEKSSKQDLNDEFAKEVGRINLLFYLVVVLIILILAYMGA